MRDFLTRINDDQRFLNSFSINPLRFSRLIWFSRFKALDLSWNSV